MNKEEIKLLKEIRGYVKFICWSLFGLLILSLGYLAEG